MSEHDTWVNRFRNPDGRVYYQAFCLCNWYQEGTSETPDDSHDIGIQHLVDTSPDVPDHKAWVNMGLEFLDSHGAKRLVYTPLCSCQWMGERNSDELLARAEAAEHELNPPDPEDD